MPRQRSAVKSKLSRPVLTSSGLIDLHFHGAFGIDLMTASEPELERLSELLWKAGIAGYCPTTLSAPHAELCQTVERLGHWIVQARKKPALGAIPIGIHLEGPYINSQACGAHPPRILRPVDLGELEELWQKSLHTLKILTIAPETLDLDQLELLCRWTKKRKIVLSLGHSRATQAQAALAFEMGFSGVTHAWNAMSYHHRDPGPMGAALGQKNRHIELIIDQVHVSPTFIRWTLELHPQGVCFVSDCVPSAATEPGSWHSFGSLKTQVLDGASRLEGGSLAGGGYLLSKAYSRWLRDEAQWRATPLAQLLKATLPCLTQYPAQALKLEPSLKAKLLKKRVAWRIGSGNQLLPSPL